MWNIIATFLVSVQFTLYAAAHGHSIMKSNRVDRVDGIIVVMSFITMALVIWRIWA